jgi:hypothetical protein
MQESESISLFTYTPITSKPKGDSASLSKTDGGTRTAQPPVSEENNEFYGVVSSPLQALGFCSTLGRAFFPWSAPPENPIMFCQPRVVPFAILLRYSRSNMVNAVAL